MERTNQRVSEKLLVMVKHKTAKETICFGAILQLLGEHAFGIALLFFTLPSALPFSAIPGVAFIFSTPILFFAVQMILGRRTLWLPGFIANKTVSYKNVIKIIEVSIPYLKKVEHLLEPRLAFMTSRVGEVVNGLVIFCLAILLMLPIPFSNFIIAGLLIIFSLGLIEKDGLVLLLGYFGTLIYGSLMSLIIVNLVRAFIAWV